MEIMPKATRLGSDGGGAHYETPYTELAAAIVLQAVKDYIGTLRRLWDKHLSACTKRNLLINRIELEEFFHSQWYEQLTDIDPERLISQCRIQAKAQEKEAIERRNKRRVKKLLEGKETEETYETGKNII